MICIKYNKNPAAVGNGGRLFLSCLWEDQPCKQDADLRGSCDTDTYGLLAAFYTMCWRVVLPWVPSTVNEHPGVSDYSVSVTQRPGRKETGKALQLTSNCNERLYRVWSFVFIEVLGVLLFGNPQDKNTWTWSSLHLAACVIPDWVCSLKYDCVLIRQTEYSVLTLGPKQSVSKVPVSAWN
jgi:hypothetical protein